ncbi:hypothetical protein [Marinoscillum furvescens]|uniref:Uncharacterized protein n=1 Tax=Marinoscillum furvescens DSM 4134 TaxID=1122208 RepID=A0A3D9L5X2_MARFU|nr:hypothetical protein [Marinoscillum furvescens]REE01309.1 hypothetical protein C7460_104332 [Marinoscillum furvescens DSM 4134]
MTTIKSYIANSVRMGQILEFEIAFPDEKRLTVEQYLAGSSREMILNAAAFFLGFKNHKSKFDDNREFLGMFFRKENNEVANQIYDRIRKFEKKGVRIGIINTYSSLKLFEYFFSKPEEPETQTQAELEVNLFKAYLTLNSEFTKKQSVAFPSAQESDEELKIPMMMFCMQYPVSDKSNYDINQIWATQMIKSIYLFQFLESHEKIQPLLAAFLAYFNCQTWQEYLKSLLPLTTPAIKSEREAHTDIVVEPGEKFEQGCAFIEKFMVQEQDELDPNDFLTIRAKPFYKVKDGVYRIIFNLFVVEKVFKGVYFQLKHVLEKEMSDEERKQIKIKNLKSFFGDEFSERILCYKVMESIYPDKCIRFSGKELADMKINAAPDYYVRKGKNIVLIESKDFLIAADKKMSFDFNVYEEEFGRVLDYEELPGGKIKPKAIVQLINSIRRILKNEFYADTDYYYKDVFIYPVLLTHDHQYDTPGFNELIDFWFQDALLELAEEGLFIHHIKPISVINIDSLIYNQVGLSTEIPLHEMLNLYHDNKKVDRQKKKNFKSQDEYDQYIEEYKQMRMSKLIPFPMFIDKYFHKQGLWKLPPLLELVAPALFKE